MAQLSFTTALQRHVDCPAGAVEGATVRELLERFFEGQPQARGYVLDDQGRLRKHVAIFIDGRQVTDTSGLGDPVDEHSDVWVMQALSGG